MPLDQAPANAAKAEKQEKKTYNFTAEDGTAHTFSERQKVSKEYEISDESIVTKFVFRNGAVRTHTLSVSSPLFAKFAAHGAAQKFGDDLAGVDDVEDCVLAFEKLAERIDSGEWTDARSSDGLSGTSELARALVIHSRNIGQEKTPDEIKALLKTKEPAAKALMRKAKPIAAIIEELRVAKDKTRPEVAQAELESLFSE